MGVDLVDLRHRPEGHGPAPGRCVEVDRRRRSRNQADHRAGDDPQQLARRAGAGDSSATTRPRTIPRRAARRSACTPTSMPATNREAAGRSRHRATTSRSARVRQGRRRGFPIIAATARVHRNFRHDPHYALVQVQPVVPQTDRAPVKAAADSRCADTTQPVDLRGDGARPRAPAPPSALIFARVDRHLRPSSCDAPPPRQGVDGGAARTAAGEEPA